MANNCDFYNYIVISTDVFRQEIVLFKCCIKNGPNEYITRIPFKDWDKIDPYQLCLDNIDKFGESHDDSLCGFCIEKGAEGRCYKTGNELKRVCVYTDFSCNANCTFCKSYQPSREKLRQDKSLRKNVKKIHFDILEKLKGHNIEVELTCIGEPFFYKSEIKQFFRNLKDNDYKKISIVTNGSLIDDEIIELAKASNINFFFLVSLNVPNEKAYNEIMGLKNFDKTFNNVLKIKKAGIDINTTFTICSDSLKYLNEYQGLFNTLKENNIRIEIREDYNNRENLLKDERLHQLQEWAK